MCDPVSIIMLAVAAVGISLSASQSHQERKAQKSAAQDASNRARVLEEKTQQAAIDAENEATEKSRKQRAAQTKTIQTSPMGVPDEAPIVKPTLLGV